MTTITAHIVKATKTTITFWSESHPGFSIFDPAPYRDKETKELVKKDAYKKPEVLTCSRRLIADSDDLLADADAMMKEQRDEQVTKVVPRKEVVGQLTIADWRARQLLL